MVKNRICAVVNLTEDSSRLKPLTNNRPIAALPFAGRYRIIDFILSDISHANIDSAALFIGESGRSVYDHIRSGASWHLHSFIRGGIFTYSHQDWKREHQDISGESDYYENHRLFIERSRAGYVFVSGSKVIANIDIRAVHHSHLRVNRDITAIYKRVSKQETYENQITLPGIYFDEDENIEKMSDDVSFTDQAFANIGLNMYLISSEIMLEMIDRAEEEKIYLELNDLIGHYMNEYTLYPYEYTGYAANIDSIEKYYYANMDMLERAKYNSLFETSIPVLTKSKHGVPAYYAEQSYVRNAFVGTDSMIKGEVRNSLLNRRTTIEDDAVILNSILLQGAVVGQGARIEYAIVDKNTVIEPGVQIIGSPDSIIVIEKNSTVVSNIGIV